MRQVLKSVEAGILRRVRGVRNVVLGTAGLLLLMVAGVPLQAAESAWPETLSVHCGDLQAQFVARKRWTMTRLDYQGTQMTVEGSAYGTVFSFPGIGFIGTGHLENEPEDVRELEFYLDGKRVEGKPASLEGSTFRMVRRSRIKAFTLEGEVRFEGNRLRELARVSTDEGVPLKLVYHFMHPWVPTATDYLAGIDGGKEFAGKLLDTEETRKKFYINDEVDWVSVYDASTGFYSVARLLERPAGDKAVSMIWNVPGTYRKYYLKCFSDREVPAGFRGTYRMVTAFGSARPDDWPMAARKLAGELKE